jgi:hypothetical protein
MSGSDAVPRGLSASPPFYRINRRDNWVESRPPLSPEAWETIFEVMRHNRVTGLRALGQMTDEVLARLADLDLVTLLHLEGSRRVTDEGLKHIARMSRLEQVNLTGCSITDDGLVALRHLSELREFYLYHHTGVSDKGLENLAFCEKLERVDLLGTSAGNGVIRALTEMRNLRHFKSGSQVTDEGLPLFEHFPVFKKWQGAEPKFSLMTFDAEPSFLLLWGHITDKGVAALARLEGLFALNVDNPSVSISSAGLGPLAGLPQLGFLGIAATDETMEPIAALPRLRMLMCQDTRAGDAGFTRLSASRTIECIWGRRCYNLADTGFTALRRMPSLRGLSVSCKNVSDTALSALPEFPALREFMPMDVPDEGFRHVGRCADLEAVWCMYCRETGDAATEHLAGLKHMTTYYAGHTRITDRSLEILSRIPSIECVTLASCAGVTNRGIAALAAVPRLRELVLQGMPGITHEAIGSLPEHVRVNIEL